MGKNFFFDQKFCFDQKFLLTKKFFYTKKNSFICLVSLSCVLFTLSIPLLPLRPLLRRSRHQPPRSPSRGQPDPLGPRRTHPPPYPLPCTSGRKPSWRTSDRTCGPIEPRPQRWRWCCSTCRQLSAPWPSHLRAQRLGAGS